MSQRGTSGRLFQRLAAAAVIVWVLLITASTVAAAATLEDYKTRLGAAHRAIDELIGADPSMSGLSGFQKGKADQIRSSVPTHESVEWRGGSAAVDNTWLHDELDAFAAEVNLSKQNVILTRISKRIDAVEAVAAEALAASAGENSKDDDKRKLADILARHDFNKPPPESESFFQRLRRQIIDWLDKMFPAVNIEPREGAQGLSSLATVLQVLLYAAVAGGILFLLYRFLPFFKRRSGRSKVADGNDRVILGERIAAEMSSTDLFSEAERLARNGELRLAIRKGYVALLCELSDRKLIGLACHKTNRDYLRDLRPRQDIFDNVRGLTGSFERHWYGSEASAEQDWEEFRTLYRETVGRA